VAITSLISDEARSYDSSWGANGYPRLSHPGVIRSRPAKTAKIVVDWVNRALAEIYAVARCGGCRFQFHGSSSAMRLAG
jgi:hypothetical protein